jgi:hypothetical protein
VALDRRSDGGRRTNNPLIGDSRAWPWFLAWFLVGAGYAVGLIGILSIGIIVLPLAIVASLVLARRAPARRGLPGLIGWIGVPPLYVAYLNRAGPGNICTQITGGQTCTQEYSPWPWVVAGCLLVTVGVVVFVVRERTQAQQSTNRGTDCP